MNTESKTQWMLLYPLWLRAWHWTNALLFIILLTCGFSLHFADSGWTLVPFATARTWHNLAGLALTVGYLVFVLRNWTSGNIRHYKPDWRGWSSRLLRQAHYYGVEIFQGAAHPFPVRREQKFNPLQQLTYVCVVYLGLPTLIVTGLLLLRPELAPEAILGMAGLWLIAVVHYLAGVGLTVFLIMHIYLATVGKTLTSDLKKMITGWEEVTLADPR
ncbi:MAG: cytochrome b/b6 domain-containing protein [Magnetococcales bacterium]|nr:cytochrome b/b6 domain-containing protein [Magnetococcales bacterium]